MRIRGWHRAHPTNRISSERGGDDLIVVDRVGDCRPDGPVVERLMVLVHVDPPGPRCGAVDGIERLHGHARGVLQVVHGGRPQIRERCARDRAPLEVRRGLGRIVLEVHLDAGLRGLEDVVPRFARGGGGSPVVRVHREGESRGLVVRPQSVRTRAQQVGGHEIIRRVARPSIPVDQDRIHGRGDRSREGREDVRVRDRVSEVPVAHVQLDRVVVDHLEGLVRIRHRGEIGRRGILEIDRVQVGLEGGNGGVDLIRGRRCVHMRVVEILTQDELGRLVHEHRPVQAVPHHVGVEQVPV